MNDLTVREPNAFEAMIKSLAENPNVDVEKLKQIVDLQERIIDKGAHQAFNAAMMKAQAEMPIVPRDKKNTQTDSMYSKYETVLQYTKPVYTKNGFSIMFYEGDAKNSDDIRVMADVMHEAGHTKTVFIDVPMDMTGIAGKQNKTKTHGKGSSISYGKQYLIKMVFNIPTGDDDDGNKAGSQYISDEQQNVLDALIRDNFPDAAEEKFKKFLVHMKVESIDQIRTKDFQKARAAIQASISAKVKK